MSRNRVRLILAGLLLSFAGWWHLREAQPPQHDHTARQAAPSDSPLPRVSRAQTTTAPAEFVSGTEPAAPESAFEQFERWSARYISAEPAERPTLITEGVEIATRRRAALIELIENNPEAALAMTVPLRIREELPPAVVQQLEERVAGRGDLAVIAVLPDEDQPATIRPVERFVETSGRTFRTFVYGTRLSQSTTANLPFHGIAVDDALALHESPIRAFETGETPDPQIRIHNQDEQCPVSRKDSGRAVAAQVGDEVVYLCTGSHIASMGEELAEAENRGVRPMAATWSQGTKTVLFMRAIFTDDTAESISDSAARTMMTNVSNWFAENSYSTTEMITTVTPLLTMPKTKEWYKTNNNYSALLTDARAVAKASGYDTANYNLDCVHFKSVFSGWSGRGYVGGKGTWLQSGTSVGVACHEFGHNYGLWHANFWNATGDTIIGPGSNTEYGNPFDTMGSASAGDRQFNAYEKNKLAWLPATNVQTITTSGVYRLHAFDLPALTDGLKHALKVKKDARDYWIELRRKFTGNRWIQNGVLLNWSPWASSAGGSHLLDTTPGSPAGTSSKDDAAVVLGRTFTDPFAGIHITPVRKYTNSPEAMDVVVNLGFFEGNGSPTVNVASDSAAVPINTLVNFTAYGSDPDSDALAHYWDFGDQTFGTNGPTATKSWSAAGEYVVRCVVSDMKGGTSSDAVVVRVGSPGTFQVSGRITLNGQPLDGVRVYASSSKVSYTDADGRYTLTALSSGTNSVSAAKAGFVFARDGFSNPVTLGPNRSNLNFLATPAFYSVSGKVTDNNVGVAGVAITIGTNSTFSGPTGMYTLANVSAGNHLLLAGKPGYELRPVSGWTNPILVEWGDVTNRNFERPLFVLSGTLNGINAAAVVSIGETNHQATAYSNSGTWRYSVSVPRGQWNLVARLNGFTLRPANFTNPLTVNAAAAGLNFTAVAGTTYSISGNISDGGTPLPGVRVQAGAESAITDSVGTYQLIGLAAGTYDVTPTLTDYSFTPVALVVPLTNANAVNQNFAATAAGVLALADPSNGAGDFRFTLTSPRDRVLRIESSANLVSWETLTTLTNTSGAELFLDGTLTSGARFYRAVQLR